MNRNQNGRRGRQQNRRRRQPNRGGTRRVPATAVGYVCGMFDPFCKHSLNAKVPSEGSFRSVSANISDFATVTASQDATTLDYYVCQRRSVGLEQNLGDMTMNASAISAAAVTDSAWQASLSELLQYRVVASAVRVRYTGAPLNASGYFRIYKVSNGTSVADVGASAGFPDSMSDLPGLYWDYSPSELAKGVTVFLNKTSRSAEKFIGPTGTDQKYNHEAFAIFGLGLDSAATITIELRQTIEFIPQAGSTAALVATPNHPHNPAIEQASSHLASTVHAVTGGAATVGKQVAQAAGHGIWNAIKDYGSKALSSLPGMIESAAEGLLPLVGEGLMMLL